MDAGGNGNVLEIHADAAAGFDLQRAAAVSAANPVGINASGHQPCRWNSASASR
jgi:hypothetical protein